MLLLKSSILLVLLISACGQEPYRNIVRVDKNQTGYFQIPKTVVYIETDADGALAICGPETHGCLTQSNDTYFITCDMRHEFECKAHELDHIVYGPKHE